MKHDGRQQKGVARETLFALLFVAACGGDAAPVVETCGGDAAPVVTPPRDGSAPPMAEDAAPESSSCVDACWQVVDCPANETFDTCSCECQLTDSD